MICVMLFWPYPGNMHTGLGTLIDAFSSGGNGLYTNECGFGFYMYVRIN